MPTVRPTFSFSPLRLKLKPVLLSLLLLSLSAPAGLAQDGATTAATQGQNALNAQDYQGAVTAFSTIVNDYKTSLTVPEAYAKLGYAYLLLNDLPKAEENVREALKTVNLTDPVKEFAMGILPQVLSARAASATDKAEKVKTYESAIKEFDAFLTAFPKSTEVEGALYGKALAQYFSEKYDDAASTLNDALAKFPNTESVADTKYLLAVTKTSQAAVALRTDASRTPAAVALFREALKLLDEIISMQGPQRSMSLINDAFYQAGDLYFNLGVLETDTAKQRELMEDSLTAFRSVQPLAPMLEAQQARIKEILARVATPEVIKVPGEVPRLLKLKDRELIKLEQLKVKPPQTLDAKIKISRIFNTLGQFDESRVILKFIAAGGFEMADDLRKQALYYMTMGYALQGKMDQALANYEEFQKNFAGDEMAENLPLVIGNLFLSGAKPEPEKALEFFDKALQQYPNGELAAAAKMARGQALLTLGRLDDAQTAFTEALAAKPAPDIAAGAELGKGVVQLQQQKWDDAIASYQGILTKYAALPAAQEAQIRLAYAQQQKGDLPAATATIDKFLATNKEGPLVSQARYTLGDIYAAQKDNGKAIEAYNKLATELPESAEAPIALLQVSNLQSLAGDTAGQEATLKQYLDKYPKDENVYFAYGALVRNKVAAGAPAEAAALWGDFATKFPDHASAGTALIEQARMLKSQADARGGYATLDPAGQTAWKDEMSGAITAAERIVKEMPESPNVAAGLSLILEIKRAQVAAAVEKPENIAAYFQTLADSVNDTPAAKSQTLFVLASYVQPQDPARALTIMQSAYNPDLVFNAKDLDIYATALLTQDKPDEAAAIFTKIMKDYPMEVDLSATTTPDQLKAELKKYPLEIQTAQAIGYYGLGKVAQAKGDATVAAENFQKLQDLFPWSPKILEAQFGIAQGMLKDKKFEDALKLINKIVQDRNATNDLRARCLLLAGFVHKDNNNLDGALDNFKKIYLFYGAIDEPSAEGLYEAAQIYKAKGMATDETNAITILKSKYPNTKWATM